MPHLGPWRKPTKSNPHGNCFELRFNRGEIEGRDSKLGDDSPVLTGFDALRDSIRAGRL